MCRRFRVHVWRQTQAAPSSGFKQEKCFYWKAFAQSVLKDIVVLHKRFFFLSWLCMVTRWCGRSRRQRARTNIKRQACGVIEFSRKLLLLFRFHFARVRLHEIARCFRHLLRVVLRGMHQSKTQIQRCRHTYKQTIKKRTHYIYARTHTDTYMHTNKANASSTNHQHTLQAKGKHTTRISMTVFGFCAFFPRICESSSKAKVCFNRSHTSGRTFSQPVNKNTT